MGRSKNSTRQLTFDVSREFKNTLYFGDCLDVLRRLHNESTEGFIDLVYIDPPFNSKRDYNILFEKADLKDVKAQKEAFADTWSNVSYKDTIQLIKEIDLDLFYFLENLDKIRISKSSVAYLTTMAIRIWYIHKVIKSTGSLYLHCDPTMSHYLKLVCDLIFGERNFRNEIIWHYRRWTGDANGFLKMHDTILFYAKDKNEIKFNVQYTPYTEKSLHRKQHYHTRIKGDDIYETSINEKGVKENDVWQIQHLNSQSKERLGYPTQKPEELLKRIIHASSNDGDVIADFFCGCGTTISVAQELGRKWLGVDISHLAIGLIERRLIAQYGSDIKKTYEIDGFPKDLASARQLAVEPEGGRFKFQDWIIEAMLGGVHNPKKTADGGWDGHLTFAISDKKREVVLVEVKSGHVNVKNIREFIHVVDKQKAGIGLFICFEEFVTKPMMHEAKSAGYYYFNDPSWGSNFDKIQIITVDELLSGRYPNIPNSKYNVFKSAKRKLTTDSVQSSLDFK